MLRSEYAETERRAGAARDRPDRRGPLLAHVHDGPRQAHRDRRPAGAADGRVLRGGPRRVRGGGVGEPRQPRRRRLGAEGRLGRLRLGQRRRVRGRRRPHDHHVRRLEVAPHRRQGRQAPAPGGADQGAAQAADGTPRRTRQEEDLPRGRRPAPAARRRAEAFAEQLKWLKSNWSKVGRKILTDLTASKAHGNDLDIASTAGRRAAKEYVNASVMAHFGKDDKYERRVLQMAWAKQFKGKDELAKTLYAAYFMLNVRRRLLVNAIYYGAVETGKLEAPSGRRCGRWPWPPSASASRTSSPRSPSSTSRSSRTASSRSASTSSRRSRASCSSGRLHVAQDRADDDLVVVAVVHVRPRPVAALGPVEVLVVRDLVERRLGDELARPLARQAALALDDEDPERGAEARRVLALLRALGGVGHLGRMLGGVVGAGGGREQGEGEDGDEEWAHTAAQPSARCATLSAMVIDDLDTLLARARGLIAEGRRSILGIAGPPGGGKSTLAHLVADALGDAGRARRDGRLPPRPVGAGAARPARSHGRPRHLRRGRLRRAARPPAGARGGRGRLRARVPARDRGAVRGRDRDPARDPAGRHRGQLPARRRRRLGARAAAARRVLVRGDGRGHAPRLADPAPHRVRQDARRRPRLGDALRSGQRRGDRRHARARGRDRPPRDDLGGDHARADGVVRPLVDEDERAGDAVGGVGLDRQRARDAQAHVADVVEREAVGRRRALGGREVEPVAHLVDDRAHGRGAVLEGQPRARAQRRLGEPADVGQQLARRHRRRLGGDEHVPAPEVEVTVDAHRHRLPGRRGLQLAVERLDRDDARAQARRQRDDLGARPQLAARDAARVGAPVAGRVAQHPLDREAQLARHAGRQLDRLEVLEQRRPRVPVQPRRSSRPRCRRAARSSAAPTPRRARPSRRSSRSRPRCGRRPPRTSRRGPSC